MTLYSLVDIVTGVMGITLEIHEFVYNWFMYITLGSFGIAGLEKFSPSTVKKVEAAHEEWYEKIISTIINSNIFISTSCR